MFLPSQRGRIPCQRHNILALACVILLWSLLSGRAQTLEETQKQFLAGKYDEVAKTAQAQMVTAAYEDGWRVLLVKSLLSSGRYVEARSNALAAVQDFPRNFQLRLLAREALLYQGNTNGAQAQLDEIRNLIPSVTRADLNSDNLVALGRALLMLGVEPRLALENFFQRAYTADPPNYEAYLAAGQLALDKHDFPLAADTFRAGLEKFPDNPDLEEGVAEAFVSSDPDQTAAALKAALAVNPHQSASLLLLADHMIDAEQYDDASKQLNLALEANPWNPDALAYEAVLAHVHFDLAKEGQFRAKALKYWTNNPRVDYLIGLKLAQKYLFTEGAAAERRALAFDPDYLPATRQLAQDLLRLGQEAEGWALAEEARSADQYDVTTYNLSTLHDEMRKFTTLTNQDFVLRMPAQEAPLYGQRVLDLLAKERTFMCAKYDVQLTLPTEVEIFNDPKDFAVRTFGMPGNPGYLGVCFGSVITANSPASQLPNPANWADVLWHEFTHVVTLNDTKNRMPRWLSEGISVYEERQADAGWGERMNLTYRDMILHGKLTPLGELSGAFLQPKNGASLQFAYFESSLVVQYIVDKYGLDTLKKILLDLRDGKPVNDAIAARTVPLPDLEKQFAAYARAQADALAPGTDLDSPPEDANGEAQEAWEKLHPDSYYLRMREAQELLDRKKWDLARPMLQSLAASYHGERRGENPLWMEAIAERNLNDTNAEYATLQGFATQEGDFVELYQRLIELAGARRDWAAETRYAERLLQINPLTPVPYRALAEAGAGSGDKDEGIAAYRALLLLDPSDPASLHFALARLLHQRGGAEGEAKRHVLQALEDAPRYREAQQLLLEIEASSTNSAGAAHPPS